MILLLLLIFVLWLVEEGATSGFVVEELAWVLAFCRLTHLHEFVEALRNARSLSGVTVGVQRLEGNVLFGRHLGTVLLDALDRSVRVGDELEDVVLCFERFPAEIHHGLIITDDPRMIEDFSDFQSVGWLSYQQFQDQVFGLF